MASPTKFAMQGALDVLFLGGATNTTPEAFLEDCTVTGLEFNAEKVYTMGKNGAYLVGFGHSRRSTATITHGYPTTEILALQSGNTTIVGANTNVVQTEILTIVSDEATTSKTALGAVGSEIGTIFVLNSDNSFGTELTQAGTASATEFTYTVGTKTILTSGLTEGDRIFVVYNYTTDATAQTVKFDGDVFAGNKKVVFTGLAKSLCGGDKLYKAQVIYHKADIGDGFSFSFEDTGDPITQEITVEALLDRCGGSDTMVEFILFDEELAT